MENKSEVNKNIHRKPSFKNRKPPEVKLNAAAKYRLLKNNPLLTVEKLDVLPTSTMPDDIIDLPQKVSLLNNNNTLNNLSKSNETLKKKNTASKSNVVKSSGDKVCAQKFNKVSQNTVNYTKKNKETVDTFKKPEIRAKKLVVKTLNSPKEQPRKNKKVPPLRRSLSAQHFNRKKGKSQNPESCITRTDSTQSLDEAKIKRISNIPIKPDLCNVKETSFNTPMAYKRRSVAYFTPGSVKRSSTPGSSALTSKDLKSRLDDWLKRRGKSLASFHHLKCFGLHNNLPNRPKYSFAQIDFDEENKENLEVVEDLSKGSYEDLKILEGENGNAPAVALDNTQEIARDALADLHKLILEGYPCDQCENWLGLIRQKYRKLDEEPAYWECRAAIEQERGNITSAVEFYKTAIVQGADEQVVDKSLDQLLQKFSLLDINAMRSEEPKNDRSRMVVEVRNVFKSSIIQFAVQERVRKINEISERKYFVTPVRRSTRSRRSAAFTSTPGVKLCSSIFELEDSIKETMEFHTNNALC